ncbi:MAG: hypothetical protein RLZZ262_2323 [Bacteroidota bacterium]|jgi:phosphoribosylglycinamide formyltransferase 1
MAFYICSMRKTRIALFASGSGSNARKIMEYFAQHDRIEVGLLLANKAEAGALVHAHECGIPHQFLPNSVFRQGTPIVEELREHRIDVVVLAGFLLLIPPALIEAYPNRIVNIHPALLPKYGGKGMYGHFVHEAVAAAGEVESGITIHLVTEAYDEGPILAQHRATLTSEDNALTIENKVRKLELEHFAVEIEKWILSNPLHEA